METTTDENPYLGIEYVPFTNRFAAFWGDSRSRYRHLIGTYGSLRAAIDARKTALKARKTYD